MTEHSVQTSPAFSRSKSTAQLMFSERKAFGEQDDNTPWLISLADLLAILLVFCLVLLSFTITKKTSVSLPAQIKQKTSSLVPIAEARGNQKYQSISLPLDLCQLKHGPVSHRHTDEKTILKISIPFGQDTVTLNQIQKNELQRFTALYKQNETSKIIIAAPIEATPHALPITQNIITYLAQSCGIKKEHIYLTSNLSPSDAYLSFPNNLIEVSLLKEFWSF